MQQRRTEHSSTTTDRWLVSYSDFLTLLFAFFVVLYASAKIDNEKTARAAASIRGAFGALSSIPDSGAPAGPRTRSNPSDLVLDQDLSTAVSTHVWPDEAQALELYERFKKVLGAEISQEFLTIREGPEGLVVSLKEIGFFRSGDTTMLPNAAGTLEQIARILEEGRYVVRIEGHTDNIPIHNSRFRSNWELSSARATEVVRLFIEEYRYEPSRIYSAGFAEYRPVVSNATEAGRRSNRRVDIVVLSKLR